MTTYQILYWHDIPSQVRAREGRERASVPLSERFQEAIDNAAMACGLIGSDDYTNAFTWTEAVAAEGSPQEVAQRVAAKLETAGEIDWKATAERVKKSG